MRGNFHFLLRLLVLGMLLVHGKTKKLTKRHLLKQSSISLNPLSSDKPFTYTSYDNGMYCTPTTHIQTPRTVTEVQRLVRYGIRHGIAVKALGSLHSVTDIICTDGIPIYMGGINHAIINEDGTATFGAGLQLFDALEFLEKKQLSLIQVPTFGGVSIGGAIGTGAHGSSLLHPASISDQVVALTIMDGHGKLRIITEDEELSAFRVNLGLLGIVVEVTLKTVPLFKFRVETGPEPDSILFDGTALSWAKQYDWFELHWFPSLEEVVVLKGKLTDACTLGNATSGLYANANPQSVVAARQMFETLQATRNLSEAAVLEIAVERALYSSVPGRTPTFSEDGVTSANPAVGYGWRLQTARCSEYPWNLGKHSLQVDDISMGVDVSKFAAVFTMMKNVLYQSPTNFYMIGVLIRFSKASPSLMSFSSGKDIFVVEWTSPMRIDKYQDAKLGLAAFQAIQQEIIENYGGRAPWGKNGAAHKTKRMLSLQHPNRQAFIRAMQKFDRQGLFLNKFGERMLGVSNKADIDPAITRCALQDNCFCKDANDCGVGQYCRKINEFHVCKDD